MKYLVLCLYYIIVLSQMTGLGQEVCVILFFSNYCLFIIRKIVNKVCFIVTQSFTCTLVYLAQRFLNIIAHQCHLHSSQFLITNFSQDLEPAEGIKILSVVDLVKLSVMLHCIKTLIAFQFLSLSKRKATRHVIQSIWLTSLHYRAPSDLFSFSCELCGSNVDFWAVLQSLSSVLSDKCQDCSSTYDVMAMSSHSTVCNTVVDVVGSLNETADSMRIRG